MNNSHQMSNYMSPTFYGRKNESPHISHNSKYSFECGVRECRLMMLGTLTSLLFEIFSQSNYNNFD